MRIWSHTMAISFSYLKILTLHSSKYVFHRTIKWCDCVEEEKRTLNSIMQKRTYIARTQTVCVT